MVLLGNKAIVKAIIENTISSKRLVIYSFIAMGAPLVWFEENYPDPGRLGFLLSLGISIIAVMISIYQYIRCYAIIKEYDAEIFIHSVIPLTAVLSLRYLLLAQLPLQLIGSLVAFAFFENGLFWNSIFRSMSSLIATFLFVTKFLHDIQIIYSSLTKIRQNSTVC